MQLTEFLERHVEPTLGPAIPATPLWQRLWRITKSERRTSTIILSAIGQFIPGTSAYRRNFARQTRSTGPAPSWSTDSAKTQALVLKARALVSEVAGRGALVVFEPGRTERDIVSTTLDNMGAQASEITRELQAWLVFRRRYAEQSQPLRLRPTIASQAADDFLSVASASDRELVRDILQMQLVICSPQRMVSSSCLSPAHACRNPGDPRPAATVGVYATDGRGQFGATTALHALHSTSVGTPADVDGVLGHVIRSDAMSDACFIGLPGISVQPVQKLHGPTNRPPWTGMNVQFEGVATSARPGPVQAQIAGIDPSVSFPMPGGQQRIYTNAVTARGDSGAVLLDTKNEIIGFAYERTAAGAQVGLSAWHWGWRVFDDLDLPAFP